MEYRLGLYEKATPASLSWSERLRAAKDAGFDFLELSIDESAERQARLDWGRAERVRLQGDMAAAGLPIRSLCLSAHRRYALGSPEKAVRERGMEIMRKALTLADALGIRLIQLAGYDVFYQTSSEETERLFRENLAACVELAAVYGVQMGFETMDTCFMNTTAKAMHYVKRMDSPYLGLYPDIGNLTNAAVLYQDSAIEDLHLGQGHILALHMKETVPGKDRGVPFGQGHVDFARLAREAWRLGVRRYVAECWDDGAPNWRETLASVNRFVRAAIDAAGAESAI